MSHKVVRLLQLMKDTRSELPSDVYVAIHRAPSREVSLKDNVSCHWDPGCVWRRIQGPCKALQSIALPSFCEMTWCMYFWAPEEEKLWTPFYLCKLFEDQVTQVASRISGGQDTCKAPLFKKDPRAWMRVCWSCVQRFTSRGDLCLRVALDHT